MIRIDPDMKDRPEAKWEFKGCPSFIRFFLFWWCLLAFLATVEGANGLQGIQSTIFGIALITLSLCLGWWSAFRKRRNK